MSKMNRCFIHNGCAASVAIAQEASKTDPNHLKTGGYGYLIGDAPDCSLWWAEADYFPHGRCGWPRSVGSDDRSTKILFL